jgi:prepilin-type N-terminal cleavage/methylation domain-containing protein
MRRAFTVVELLVVLAIIGVMMALIIPAVQFAREAARKTQCSSQLKQIAIAATAHHTAFEYFPNAGGRDGASRSTNAAGVPHNALRQDWGVFYQILPYIEQKPVWEQPNPADAAAAKIKIYFCPTRRPPTAVSGSSANGLLRTAQRGGVDYAGNGGSGGVNPAAPNALIVFVPGPSTGYDNSLNYQSGVIIPRPGSSPIPGERITGASIRDGLSNVLMFGERNYHRKPPAVTQLDEDNGYINGWSQDTIRWSTANTPNPDPDRVSLPTSNTRHNNDTRFGGPHTGVLMLAYCDGSVRPYRYGTLDLASYMQLLHRSDGKSPQVP